MARTVLTDTTWAQLQSTMKAHGVIYRVSYTHGKLLIIVSTDYPKKAYGSSFFDLRAIIDKEWVFTDGSYIRCHQHLSGARG